MVFQESYDAHLLFDVKTCTIRNRIDAKIIFNREAIVFSIMKDMQLISN